MFIINKGNQPMWKKSKYSHCFRGREREFSALSRDAQGYSWFCAQHSLLMVLRNPMLEIKLRLTICKVSALTPVLALQPHSGFNFKKGRSHQTPVAQPQVSLHPDLKKYQQGRSPQK